MPAPYQLAGLVEEITPSILELRRLLHLNPEPAHREFRTTELIRSFIEDAGLQFQGRQPATGGWVDIGDDPIVGFRADIDALPILEPAENSPRSTIEGWMHACGHDAHTAIAAGIAVVLSRLRLAEGFRVLFQPAEEAFPGGAIDLVNEGAVDGLQALLAFHVDPTLPVGKVGARVGPITAGADAMTIVVNGPGGHTSRPHKTVDLVAAAARVAIELPSAMRNSVDARSPIVTAFGSIRGGDAANVIPTEVTLTGTVRTVDPELWDVLPSLVDKLVDSIVAVTGARYTLDYQRGIAPVVNDELVVNRAREAIRSEMGNESVVGTEMSMGGEDFCNYLPLTRGALLRLGAASGGGDLHSSSFMLNEEAIPFAVQAGVSALLRLARS